MRTIIIGDVHGCLDEFQALLDLVSFRRGADRLVSVGDLMDRGPDPVGCVRFAREVGADLVLGNHEEKHLRWRRHEARRAATGKKNPMKPFPLIRQEQNQALSEDDINWITAAPLSLDLGGGLIAVHAGLEPAFKFQDQSNAVIRVRYVDEAGEMVGYADGSLEQPSNTVYWSERWRGPESVVYGHAVHSLAGPRLDEFPGGACYGIDTGCVYGGHLTAMIWVPGSQPEFAQVPAAREYFAMSQGRSDA